MEAEKLADLGLLSTDGTVITGASQQGGAGVTYDRIGKASVHNNRGPSTRGQ